MIPDPSTTVTRRRVLASVIVGGGSAVVLPKTLARLQDGERSTGNDLRAGTLDLKLDGGDSRLTVLDVSGLVPGDSGTQSVDVSNDGSTTGTLRMSINVTTDTEGTSGGVDGTGGELDSSVELAGTFAGTTVWSYATASQLSGSTYTLDGSFGTGTVGTFTLDWRVPHSTTSDASQDATTVELTFELQG